MRVFLIWIKEVFSHKAFIISNIILLLSITIFTFAFSLFKSITDSTDTVIRTLLTGDYLLTSDSKTGENVRRVLKNDNVIFDEAIFKFALFKTKTESYPLQLRIVEKTYFSPRRKQLLGIKEDVVSGLYISKTNESDGMLIIDGEKRGKVYKNPHTFKSDFALLDENIAFFVVDNLEDYMPISDISFIVIEENARNGKRKTFDTVYKIYKEYGVMYDTRERLVENFYSSLSASWSSFYLISMMFVLLSSIYTISIALSFKKDNKLLLKTFEIYGLPYSRLFLYSLLSVLFTIMIFILLGFALGLLLTKWFPVFASILSKLFDLDISYYFLSFSLSVPFFQLFRVYLFEAVLSFIIASFTFLISFKKGRAIWM